MSAKGVLEFIQFDNFGHHTKHSKLSVSNKRSFYGNTTLYFAPRLINPPTGVFGQALAFPF